MLIKSICPPLPSQSNTATQKYLEQYEIERENAKAERAAAKAAAAEAKAAAAAAAAEGGEGGEKEEGKQEAEEEEELTDEQKDDNALAVSGMFVFMRSLQLLSKRGHGS